MEKFRVNGKVSAVIKWNHSENSILVRNYEVYTTARAQINASNIVQFYHAKDLTQKFVSLSFVSQRFFN